MPINVNEILEMLLRKQIEQYAETLMHMQGDPDKAKDINGRITVHKENPKGPWEVRWGRYEIENRMGRWLGTPTGISRYTLMVDETGKPIDFVVEDPIYLQKAKKAAEYFFKRK